MRNAQSSSRICTTAVAALITSLALIFTGACEPGGDTRVARWPLSVFPGAEKKKALATLSQGELVELIAPGEVFTEIRMVDGQTGYVETKHLFLFAAVLGDADARLFRRPSASSGEAASGKYLEPGDVFFVKSREKNEESDWMSVEGGRKGDFFRGWLKADVAHSADIDTVQAGLRLAEAIRKADLEALEELSARSDAIGPAAAAALVDIEGPEADDANDGDGGQASENEEGSEASDVESGDDSRTQDPGADEQGGGDSSAINDDAPVKPAPPAPPSGEVSAPGLTGGARRPPPPPPSL